MHDLATLKRLNDEAAERELRENREIAERYFRNKKRRFIDSDVLLDVIKYMRFNSTPDNLDKVKTGWNLALKAVTEWIKRNN